MIPWHIQSRSQFVEQVHALCPTRAAQRAIREGRITMLGGFYDIPPFGRPGFICHVTSRHGRTWFLALVRQLDRSFRGVYIENIPWENQVVHKTDPARWALNGGDPLSSPHNTRKQETQLDRCREAMEAVRFCPPPRITGEK